MTDTFLTHLFGWFSSCLELTARAAPYLLIGLLGAGLLQALLPQDLVNRLLGGGKKGRSARAVFIASFIGAPLPL
ncbi:hypothetical protein [Oceanidesulfovibrio marinus]|uniref:Permease n=1 Tax=Oceanidesulfovibrio marinus TaxID=370038 RepID=A0ABX6NN13_9BACT|nr:hypothetical protein [Oceanidesulfovibrio marinus]QJT11015.1 hypothetical protein E8L03_19780 [Oceanidesulfovibrio marinus]